MKASSPSIPTPLPPAGSRIRDDRLRRGIPAKEYKKQVREQLLADDIPAPARALYRDVLAISPGWAREFRAFWDLPGDFEVPA